MPKVILDASAVIALLRKEAGHELVATHIGHAAMSSVNLSEVAAFLIRRDIEADQVRQIISDLSLEIHDFDQAQALACAFLIPKTAAYGLSIADRACFSLASALNVPVLTADTIWKKVNSGVEVIVIR